MGSNALLLRNKPVDQVLFVSDDWDLVCSVHHTWCNFNNCKNTTLQRYCASFHSGVPTRLLQARSEKLQQHQYLWRHI